MRTRVSLASIPVALMIAMTFGTSVRLANLAELVGVADRVFHGRCISLEEIEMAGLPAIKATFEVLDAVKGVTAGRTVVFRQVTGTRGRLAGIPGIPSYRKGEEVLLFLAGDSGIGLTSPIGLGQGVFRVRFDSRDQKIVANGINNTNLSQGVDEQEGASMGLSKSELESLTKGPVRLDFLLSAARRIHDFQSGTSSER